MVNKRIKTYWLVLLAVLMAVNMLLSVEPTQAHYTNTTTWNTVVEAEENAVTSKFMTKNSEAPITVLVGEIPMEEYRVYIPLNFTKDVSGSLTWSIDQAEYMDVFMSTGDTNLAPNGEIQWKTGTTDVMLLMIPTEAARNTVHDPLDINVTVKWMDTLQGTFRVTIPAVTEDDLIEEPTQPEETQPEETQPEETQPEETQPEETQPEETQPEETQPEETQPEETQPKETQPEETQPEETEPAPIADTPEETAEITNVYQKHLESAAVQAKRGARLSGPVHMELQEPVAAEESAEEMPAEPIPVPITAMTETEPIPNPNEPEPIANPDPTEPEPIENPDPTEPSEPEPTEPPDPAAGEEEPQFRLETIAGFSISDKIPVKLHLTEEITQAYLGLGTASDDNITIKPFPEYTCYSLDNGESYYMLYTDTVSTIELTPGDSKQMSVLLDLSRLELFEAEELTLVANGFAGESRASSASATTIPKEDGFYQMDSLFLSQGSSLKIELNETWKDYEFTYTVEILTGSEAAGAQSQPNAPPALRYEPVDAALWSSLVKDEQTHSLTFQLAEVLPPAGTYRVRMNWSHEGICFAQKQATFFINYNSVYSESEGTGGTEQ